VAGVPESAAGEKTRARGESTAAGKATGRGPRTGAPGAWRRDEAVARRAPRGTRRRARCCVLSGASCRTSRRTRWRILCGACRGVPGGTARCDAARSAANVRRPGRARGAARAVTGPAPTATRRFSHPSHYRRQPRAARYLDRRARRR
jgi:hypothetical protein